ncbi:hypothetical protein CkP1_0154 [Citrobacter phage CkP1]|nr:hypothetical protein CkP1_0154 [Citrobacter phage CkP1]
MTNLAHMKTSSKETVRNRKKKLKERMARIISNTSMKPSEKVFVKNAMKSIFDELSLIHQQTAREYYEYQKFLE